MKSAPNSLQHLAPPEDDSAEIIPSASVLEQLTRGEVDMQVATAKRWPRAITKFQRDALSMATLNAETAGECFYALPRGGKTIEGPSVRLAEIVATCWGNLRVEARVIDIGDTMLTAQSTCWDMEKNVLVRIEVQRRITDKTGRRFADDMIVVTGNAASSIAFRNAVFKVVPFVHVQSIYEQCRKVAIGDGRSLAQMRDQWIKYFGKAGVQQEQLLATMGRASLDELDLDDLVRLQGVANALKEGTTTVDDIFGPVQAKAPKAAPKTLADLIDDAPSAAPQEVAPDKVEVRAPSAHKTSRMNFR